MAHLSDQLACQIQAGDQAAFHKFILLHRPLARRLSRRLERWFGMDADDAEQTAMIGLLMAARKFKPDLGYQFSTYATHWIRQACQRLGPEFTLTIRVPLKVFWQCFPIQLELRRLAELPGFECVRAELLPRVERDGQMAKQWQRFLRATTVQPLSQSGSLIATESTSTERIAQVDIGADIHEAISKLRPRDALVIRMRYGSMARLTRWSRLEITSASRESGFGRFRLARRNNFTGCSPNTGGWNPRAIRNCQRKCEGKKRR